jgi:uncharacterized SAM-binding protein YcdF (DUF218 family)
MWLVLAVFIAFVITEADIIYSGRLLNPQKSDCIIVLGCSVYGVTPSPFLKARLNEGLRLYKQGYGKYIIVSGGRGPGEEITEARCMKDYLIARGIDEEAVILEDRSVNTLQNIRYAKGLMELHDLRSAVVVSNSFHLLRVSRIADSEGLKATYSGVFLTRSVYWPRQVYGYIREIPAMWKYDLLTR